MFTAIKYCIDYLASKSGIKFSETAASQSACGR